MLERSLHTPFGDLTVTEENGAIIRVGWFWAAEQAASDVLDEAIAQIDAYGAGRLESFDLPLDVRGTQLQKDVCRLMSAIPFGYTRTYGDLAKDLGVPAQTIGQACGGNPIPIIIPCHRVMGAKGLTGFSGGQGVETKVALLRHEGAASMLI